ncbi:MAG: pilus assembly protein [Pelagimonas sp.]|jgi:hypothetical protein|nr:pilus assembly protein [Pelagimonas sp.]
MIRSVFYALRHFRKNENGSIAVPFVIWVPVFLIIIGSSIELGLLTARHAILERALDETVRGLRIGTVDSSSNGLKTAICDRASILPNCENRLHLEMVSLDMRDWSAPNAQAQCVDTTQSVTPNRTFDHGGNHELMLLRACFKYRPTTPTGMLGSALAKDAQGYSALVSASAFVHEPG